MAAFIVITSLVPSLATVTESGNEDPLMLLLIGTGLCPFSAVVGKIGACILFKVADAHGFCKSSVVDEDDEEDEGEQDEQDEGDEDGHNSLAIEGAFAFADGNCNDEFSVFDIPDGDISTLSCAGLVLILTISRVSVHVAGSMAGRAFLVLIDSSSCSSLVLTIMSNKRAKQWVKSKIRAFKRVLCICKAVSKGTKAIVDTDVINPLTDREMKTISKQDLEDKRDEVVEEMEESVQCSQLC